MTDFESILPRYWVGDYFNRIFSCQPAEGGIYLSSWESCDTFKGFKAPSGAIIHKLPDARGICGDNICIHDIEVIDEFVLVSIMTPDIVKYLKL